MRSPLARLHSTLNAVADEASATEHVLTAVIGTFMLANLHGLVSPLVRIARWRRRHHPVSHNKGEEQQARPSGPFMVDRSHACALLIFVPLSLKSHFIDDLTGAYGYSHIAVDVGEMDAQTRKPVMTEATLGDVVHRSFQDTYGERPYIRVPLGSLGVDCHAMRACVTSKLGQPYSDKEALTWGAIDDPAKQICSDLAANCLPDRLRLAIVQSRHHGKVRPYAVSVHRLGHPKPYVFVSPNGFAQFLGAPHGNKIDRPNVVLLPQSSILPSRAPNHPRLSRSEMLIVVTLTLVCSALIGVLVRRQHDL